MPTIWFEIGFDFRFGDAHFESYWMCARQESCLTLSKSHELWENGFAFARSIAWFSFNRWILLYLLNDSNHSFVLFFFQQKNKKMKIFNQKKKRTQLMQEFKYSCTIKSLSTCYFLGIILICTHCVRLIMYSFSCIVYAPMTMNSLFIFVPPYACDIQQAERERKNKHTHTTRERETKSIRWRHGILSNCDLRHIFVIRSKEVWS